MTDAAVLPRVLFFNINGNGMGHLSRCLAYARRLRGRAKPVFFSLASAIEVIHDMGFEADYFVSKLWSRSHINAWNRELVKRFGLMLESVRPQVVVFDGTWPFHGFMDACDIYGVPRRVWSNRGLHKASFEAVPVPESAFDLILAPGEIGARFNVDRETTAGRKVRIPPVTLLGEDELLPRGEARAALGLASDGKYALFSLGPGNLKDVGDIASGLVAEFQGRGFTAVWAKAPISVRDAAIPRGVESISVYPLVRYMRAFDIFVGAAGYNTCCEVLQSRVPSLLVPNKLVADDQTRRANMVAEHARVIVSACETRTDQVDAVNKLLLRVRVAPGDSAFELDGAERAADEIMGLIQQARNV